MSDTYKSMPGILKYVNGVRPHDEEGSWDLPTDDHVGEATD